MHDQDEGAPKRQVEFRVVCADEKGTQLVWKYANSLEDALNYLRNIDHKYLDRCEWFVYEAQVTEIIRMVYMVTTRNARKVDNPGAVIG